MSIYPVLDANGQLRNPGGLLGGVASLFCLVACHRNWPMWVRTCQPKDRKDWQASRTPASMPYLSLSMQLPLLPLLPLVVVWLDGGIEPHHHPPQPPIMWQTTSSSSPPPLPSPPRTLSPLHTRSPQLSYFGRRHRQHYCHWSAKLSHQDKESTHRRPWTSKHLVTRRSTSLAASLEARICWTKSSYR